MPTLPAPFLKRFEKYRLTVQDISSIKVERIPLLQRIIYRSMEHVNALCFVEEKIICKLKKSHVVVVVDDYSFYYLLTPHPHHHHHELLPRLDNDEIDGG